MEIDNIIFDDSDPRAEIKHKEAVFETVLASKQEYITSLEQSNKFIADEGNAKIALFVKFINSIEYKLSSEDQENLRQLEKILNRKREPNKPWKGPHAG